MSQPLKSTPSQHGEDAQPLTGAKKRTGASGGILTLRLVISVFCAILVVIVASITFAITYTASLNSVRAVGRKLATSYASTAAVEVREYFEVPAEHMTTMKRLALRGYRPIPGDDVPRNGFFPALENWARDLEALILTYFDDYLILTISFECGSILIVSRATLGSDDRLLWSMSNTFNTSAAVSCCGAVQHTEWRFPDMVQLYPNPQGSPPLAAPVTGDNYAVTANYQGAKAVLTLYQPGGWVGLQFLPGTDRLFFPGFIPLYNRSGTLIGMGTITITIDKIDAFLRRLDVTAGTRVFALNEFDGVLGASRHSSNFTLLTVPTASTIPQNCYDGTGSGLAKNAEALANQSALRPIVCLKEAKPSGNPKLRHEYAPLIAARQIPGTASTMKMGESIISELSTDDGSFFVAVVKVPNPAVLFNVRIIVIMPETDVLGDIEAQRNIAIIIVICVLLVAVASSFVMVFIVLRPLRNVSMRMRHTAKLNEVKGDTEYSNLAEVRDLQVSYSDMNNAIQSFTRYVPRDVVKDLMLTGQLCEIKMNSKHCCMLFTDIAGFTTMCERVPPDELSTLIQIYFQHMTSLVISHDGLIDKFIGDCVMAVWGAPFPCSNKEIKASLCALMMDHDCRCDPLAPAFDASGENLKVRVGVATGDVLAGNMGSEQRMNYTVIGDDVNLAARLESLNKQLSTRVMIDEKTAPACIGVLQLRKLCQIAVVGKDTGIKVYEVVGLPPSVDGNILSELTDKDRHNADLLPEGSDSLSNASAMSRISLNRENDYVVVSKTTVELISRAQQAKPSLVLSEEAADLARRLSHAADVFGSGDFAGTLKLLDDLEAASITIEAHIDSHIGKSYTASAPRPRLMNPLFLRTLAEEYVQNPPKSWDGVWRASEK